MTIEEYQTRFTIRVMRDDEAISAFDCGDGDLNDFILNDAVVYRQSLLAVTYLLEERETGAVAAYFSLANDRIGLKDFVATRDFNRFRRPKFVNAKRLKSYPAVKVCRLAVSKTLRGMGIGSNLLWFIKSFFVTDNRTGCRFLTVDAYAGAVDFYLANKFEYLNGDDEGAVTRVLYFDLNDLSR